MRTSTLNLLYKIRAWIDNRVPRDVLVIEIRDRNGHTFMRIDHLELLGSIKQGKGYASVGAMPEGATVHFTTEHLR